MDEIWEQLTRRGKQDESIDFPKAPNDQAVGSGSLGLFSGVPFRDFQAPLEVRKYPHLHRFYWFSALTSKFVWVQVLRWHEINQGQFVGPLGAWLS
jgi:hypothetical protein